MRTGSVLLPLLFAAACASKSGAPTESPEPEPFKNQLIGEPVPEVDDVTVTLLDQGRAPRVPLRYRHRTGATQSIELSWGMDMVVENKGVPIMSPTFPTSKLTATFEVLDVDDAGRAEAVLHLHRIAGLDWSRFGLDAAEFERAAKAMEDQKLAVTMTETGRIELPNLKLGKGIGPAAAAATEQLDQLLRGMAIPLPEEPVGVGGSWRTVTNVVAQGWDGALISDYRVESIDESRVALAITTEYQTKAQLISPGSHLTASASTGTGRATLDLRRPAPIETTVKLQSTANIHLSEETSALSEMTTRMTIATSMRTK